MQYLLDVRSNNALEYRNLWEFDYAFAKHQAIPMVMDLWAGSGVVDLSTDFVDTLWLNYADKRPGNAEGEWYRGAKLTNDAFKTLFDLEALVHLGGAERAIYDPNNDMRGVDLQVTISGNQMNLQMRVDTGRDYTRLKASRRKRRGEPEVEVIDCVAGISDLDTSAQPWVPNADWYARLVDHIVQRLQPESDS
jgi:hypothetical protein